MITYATFTDKGTCEINEDSMGIFEKDNKKCMVLCDGLGGHGRGEVASALVVNVFGKVFEEHRGSADEFFDEAFAKGQDALLKEQEKKHAKAEMKTTAVCLYIEDEKVSCAHVGDSRLYYFHKNKYRQRTLDHSVPQMLVLARDIKEKEIRNHPDRNRLLKVMGIEWAKKQYETEHWKNLDKKSAYLLCSDGFWELIDEKLMCKLLAQSKTVAEWVAQMADVVKENGRDKKMDNYSAIAVWCSTDR